MPVMFTLIALFLFSLWTPVAYFVVHNVNLWEFIFLAELAGLITAWGGIRFLTRHKKINYKRLRDLSSAERVTFAASGFCRIMAMGALFTAFFHMTAAQVISIYDFWPIFALYFTPALVSKNWSDMTLRNITLSLFAVGGIVLLIAPEFLKPAFADGFAQSPFKTIGILSLPLIAGVFQALSETIKGGLVQKLQIKDRPFLSIFTVDIYFGFFCFIMAGLALIVQHGFFTPVASTYSVPVIGAILLFSVVITTLGRCALSAAMARASYNIFSLWFFLPLMTLFWLWVFDMSVITPYIVFGASMITVANLLISAKADDSVAYPASIVMLLLSSLYCYFIDGQGIDDYFEGVATPLIFFVLIVAFLMDRLINRDRAEETMVVEMIQHIERHGPISKDKKHNLIQDISALIKTNDRHQINAQYQALRNHGHKCLRDVSDKLDALTLSRIQGANFGELLVLSMVGILVVLTTLVFRPEGLFGDCFAIVLSAAVCFIYFTVVDLIAMRKQFFLNINKDNHFYLSDKALKGSKLDIVISIILILVIIAAMLGVMWYHHQM